MYMDYNANIYAGTPDKIEPSHTSEQRVSDTIIMMQKSFNLKGMDSAKLQHKCLNFRGLRIVTQGFTTL